MRLLAVIGACIPLGAVAACSTSGDEQSGGDAGTDTSVASDSSGEGYSIVGGDASFEADSFTDAGTLDATTGMPDGEGGNCTLPLGTFGCSATYPATLQAACSYAGGGVVTRGTCDSVRYVVYGVGAPFTTEGCFYDDAGALMGADFVYDTNVCDAGSPELNGGQVPAGCQGWPFLYPPGDASVACDGGTGAQDGASD